MDLQLAIQSVLQATTKIFEIPGEVYDHEITILVRQSFNDGSRVTLPQLLKWASLTDEVKTYFNYFRMDGPEMISVKALTTNEYINYEKFNAMLVAHDEEEQRPGEKFRPIVAVDSATRFFTRAANLLIVNRRAINFRAWLSTALQPIVSFRQSSKEQSQFQKLPDELKVKLEWVYGIRSHDTRKALQYTVGVLSAEKANFMDEDEEEQARNQEEIVYYVGSVVVLLNTNVNKQRFYLNHDNEVISVAVSTKDGQHIASGELAQTPSIHVWSRKTLECQIVIKGDHAQGINLLQFTYDNKYLVTCGITNPSAVIIYDWRANRVAISTSIHSPTQDIFTLHEIKYDVGQNEDGDYEFQFSDEEKVVTKEKNSNTGIVVLSLKEICVFVPKDETFEQTLLPLDQCTDECELYEPMCGYAFIADINHKYHGALDVESSEKRHLFLTGHKDGKVLIWRSDCYIGILTDFEEEVVGITKCYEGIVFCTWPGRIHFWDINLIGPTKTIELQSLPFRLLSYNIANIDFNQKRLLVLTVSGDAIEITIAESDGVNRNLIKAKRINSVTKITGQQKALALLNQVEKFVMVGGDDGLVTSYDIATHQLIDVWPVGSKITALACFDVPAGGFITAAGTSTGNLVIRQEWEESVPKYHTCGSKVINDVQFSRNGLLLAAASNDKNIYLFKYVDGDYTKLSACKLENGIPVSVNFSEDNKKIVICTNQRKLLLLDPATYQLFFRADDLTQHFWSNWIGRYPLNTKVATSQSFIPISLGNQSNIVAAGDENGNVFLWRDVEAIKENVGINLTGHTSPIQRIVVTSDDKRIISLGLHDQCLFQWKVLPIEQRASTDRQMIFGMQTLKQEQENQSKIFVTDESLVNELNFCFMFPRIELDDAVTEPIVDTGLLIRGCNNSVINRLGSKYNFKYEEETWKRPPAVALVIDHIYGAQTSDRRHTVVYLHFHGDKPPSEKAKTVSITTQLGIVGVNNARLDQVLPKLLGPNFQQLLDPNEAIKYDHSHQQCHKYLVYFTSRFGILYNPTTNTQQFYQGHILKISCIQKHPLRRLIATGEVALQPSIHIWDAQSLEPLMVLDTVHKGGVLHLAFSPDGKKLVSIGMDRTFSIQIFQWEQNRTICYRNLGYYPVFGLKFYPFENSRFVTCGYQHMAVWRLQGNHLTCIAFQKYETSRINTEKIDEPLRSVIISLDFLNYRLGHTIQSDILFGTSQGEITTYCSGLHFVLNQKAHKGSVNCLKVSDKINDTVNVITGGEDGFIKIWDSTITLLQSIDMRKVPQVLKELKNERSYGVQSLELYCCDKKQPRKLLVGLRCGDILEATITDSEEKKQKQPITRVAGDTMIGMNNTQNAMLHFEFFTFVSAHSSLYGSQGQKKIACVVNPTLPVLASVGDDETLRFWDLLKKQIVISKYIGTQATAVAYSPDGSFLVIGLVNGIVTVLDAKVQKLQYGTYMEEYTMPTLDVLMSPKEAKAAVIAIKFSYRGDYLAVSFNNEHREGEDVQTTGIGDLGNRESSFVIIYVNRLSAKNPGIKLNSRDPYVKLMKIVIPLHEFQPRESIRKLMAVTQFDFSECDSYLQMCLQTINHETVIDTSSYTFGENNVFIIWDIQSNQLVSNVEQLKQTQWPDWSMAASINARYHGNEINLEDAIAERQLLFRELSFMSRISRFAVQENAICGSHEGGLYVFRFNALTVDRLSCTDFKFDLIKKKQMAGTRGFSGHTSMIQSIEIFDDKIVISSSVSDQCIVQWRVEFEDKHWDLDFNNIQMEQDPSAAIDDLPPLPPDPYNEYITKDKFYTFLGEIWSQRSQVSEINQGVSKSEYQNPACQFELEYIIGRRAFDRRMNIKIDCMDRIVYQCSSVQVFLTENDEVTEADKAEGKFAKIKQVFLRPDGNRLKTVSPELSCFCLSKDARILFCATAQTTANVYIWEVTTTMKLGEFSVPDVPIIMSIKVSFDNKNVLILGITKEYYQMITMVDWTKGNKVLFTRQFLLGLVYKIRDIEFMPNCSRSFITAGIQHLQFWKLSGSNLEFQCAELTIPKVAKTANFVAFNENPRNHGKYGMQLIVTAANETEWEKAAKFNVQHADLESLNVTFFNICFMGDTLVTSGDDGFVYLWEGFRIVRRIFAHDGAIYAMHSNSKLGLMVTGGMSGIVILWRLLIEQNSNVKSLEKLKIYNLRKGQTDVQKIVQTPECNIQSLCLGFNRIVVGMRTGSIYELVISDDRKIIKPHHDALKDPVKRWLTCSDHQLPKSVGIDMISSRIYTVTSGGLFSVWDLTDFDIIYQKDYNKKTKFLLGFKLTNRMNLIFENDIICLDTNPKKNTYEEMPEYTLMLNLITCATINPDEQILGVATISAASPDVILFGTDGGFIKIKQISGFKSSIKYIDFSTDNYYLQVEDSVGDITLYEIETDKPILEEQIDFELEWLGEGLRTYSRLKGVRHQYNSNNKIYKIKKQLGKPVVCIADELGTIRLFNYPNMKDEKYYQCYSDHLFQVSDCLFSPDGLFFVSSCEMDRSIFKWSVKYNEEKVLNMLENDMKMIEQTQVSQKRDPKERRASKRGAAQDSQRSVGNSSR